MMRTFSVALGLALAALPAAAQQRGGQAPPPMTNLQIIPKDTPREQVLQTMQAFTQALGVQCNYCHVQEGRGGRNDMAADDKQTKKTARQMMVFARELNEKLPAVVSKSANDTTRVGCSTCHRGLAIPKQLNAVLSGTVAEKGLDAGVARSENSARSTTARPPTTSAKPISSRWRSRRSALTAPTTPSRG
jgi:hypothetical protein